MAQFHIAQLFPRNKGLVSSLFVGCFIASGFTFEVQRQAYRMQDSPGNGNPAAYRTILLIHAALCLPWAPLSLWMSPKYNLKDGQEYQFAPAQCAFIVIPAVGTEQSHTREHGMAAASDSEGSKPDCQCLEEQGPAAEKYAVGAATGAADTISPTWQSVQAEAAEAAGSGCRPIDGTLRHEPCSTPALADAPRHNVNLGASHLEPAQPEPAPCQHRHVPNSFAGVASQSCVGHFTLQHLCCVQVGSNAWQVLQATGQGTGVCLLGPFFCTQRVGPSVLSWHGQNSVGRTWRP
jgi:hypothetical protein